MKSHNIDIMPITKKLEKSSCGSAKVDNMFQAKYPKSDHQISEDFDYVSLDTRLNWASTPKMRQSGCGTATNHELVQPHKVDILLYHRTDQECRCVFCALGSHSQR